MADYTRVGIGELRTGKNDEVLAAFGIGSCIVVVCYDKYNAIAGMLHAMLPEKPKTKKNSFDDNKYLDSGMDNLIKEIIRMGASIKNIEAKIFGGAKMFDIETESAPIGERNIKKTKELLFAKAIPIVAEDTGSNYGRTIEFRIADKKAIIKSFKEGVKEL